MTLSHDVNPYERLDVIESALLDAVAAAPADDTLELATERDVLMRRLAETRDVSVLKTLVARDSAFTRAVARIRSDLAREVETVRAGRQASRAYAETAAA